MVRLGLSDLNFILRLLFLNFSCRSADILVFTGAVVGLLLLSLKGLSLVFLNHTQVCFSLGLRVALDGRALMEMLILLL